MQTLDTNNHWRDLYYEDHYLTRSKRQALEVLNQWLEPTYLDHWRVSAGLQHLRIAPTQIMLNDRIYKIIREYLDQREKKEQTNPLSVDMAPLLITGFNLQFAPFWKRDHSHRDGFLPMQCDLLLGARWTRGKLILGYIPYSREIIRPRIKVEYEKPFRFEYPYTLPGWCLFIVQKPDNLEFLWTWSNQITGVRRRDREDHWGGWRQVLDQISPAALLPIN